MPLFTRLVFVFLLLAAATVNTHASVRAAISVAAADAPCDPSQPFDDAAAREILATERPFYPAERDLYISYDNPDWIGAAPPTHMRGPGQTEQEIKEELRAFLELRFPCEPWRVLDGLQVFDNPLAQQKIPDPTLRAALAALTGTIGEPAIDFLLFDAPVSSIFFGVVIHRWEGIPPGETATVYNMPDGTWVIVFDSRFRYNSFKTLSALLFHEAFHIEIPDAEVDPSVVADGAGAYEENAAIALEGIAYMQMLLTDPSIAHLPDTLTRGANNALALVRLNSGEAGTEGLNLYLPDSTNDIDPIYGGVLTQFADYYAAQFDKVDKEDWLSLETQGNALLERVLPLLVEPGEEAPQKPDFDQATLTFLDQPQVVLGPSDLIAVACIIGLDLPCD